MNMAPPRRDNNAVWWILGIVVGGILLMIIFGLALAGMFLHRVHVQNSEKKVDIQTPVGEFKVDTDGSRHTGLPVYPGASLRSDKDGNAHVELSLDDAGVGLAIETYQTDDDLGEVDAWYKKQLGPSFRRETPKSSGTHHHDHDDFEADADVAYTDDRGEGARVVALTKQDGGVRINLVHVGKREAQ
ncbi:MAG: hypothetical protein ABSC71_16225 [Candidatus Acidiferrales bacterium]